MNILCARYRFYGTVWLKFARNIYGKRNVKRILQ